MLLEELLDDTPRDLPVQVEVKAHGDPGLARSTAAAVCRAAGRRVNRGRVEVLSFHTIACEEAVRHGIPARLVAWAEITGTGEEIVLAQRRAGDHDGCAVHL